MSRLRFARAGAIIHHLRMGTPQTRYLTKRDEIIAAATAMLNEDGVGGFTLAGVAKRIGMHPASLAYYFKKKEDLAATCLMSARITPSTFSLSIGRK